MLVVTSVVLAAKGAANLLDVNGGMGPRDVDSEKGEPFSEPVWKKYYRSGRTGRLIGRFSASESLWNKDGYLW